MGVDDRKPPLPAPTEPSVLSSAHDEGSVAGTDIATDVSRRTDQTSFSLPEDGSPITISTRRKRDKDTHTSLTQSSNRSQTSLLIEYFEGSKSSGSNVQPRPSVRVKVTPSAQRKIRGVNDHILITETKAGNRIPSSTQRISLNPSDDRHVGEFGDSSSVATTTEELGSSRRPPIEVEVMHKDQSSPLSAAESPRHSRFIPPNASEISSMPPDTSVEIGREERSVPRRERSRSISQEQRDSSKLTKANLTTPLPRSRSVSRERLLAQKVVGKLEGSSKTRSSGERRKRPADGGSRSRRSSKDQLESPQSGRRRSSRSHTDEVLVAGDGRSLATESQVSQRSEQDSIRSGASTASINNPRLLQTVEDVIRRLVLPQISEIKKEQKSQRNREKFDSSMRRDSSASIESASKEASRKKLSKTSSAPDVAATPHVILNQTTDEPGEVLSPGTLKSRKVRRERGLGDSPSDRGQSEDTVTEETTKKTRRKRSGTKDAVIAGLATAAVAEAVHHDSRGSVEKERRKKKRSKSRSRSASIADSVEHTSKVDLPRMPLDSDIASSDVTRESILSEQTERPHSAASQDRRTPIQKVGSPTARTPTKTPVDIQKGLGTHHANVSRGDLSVKSAKSDRERVEPEHHGKALEAGLTGAVVGAGLGALGAKEQRYDNPYDELAAHVPASRGLSPIQSVASYRDDDHSTHHNRDSFRHVHSEGSLSSMADHSHQKHDRHFDHGFERDSLDMGYAKDDSQYWDEQHLENNRNRRTFDSTTSDQTLDPRRLTGFTDDSITGTFLEKVAAGQHVLGVGANPEYRYTPVAARSAVASLHEPSILETRSIHSDHSKKYLESYPASVDEAHQIDTHGANTRGIIASQENSPTKRGPPGTSYSDGAQSTSQKSFVQRMADGATPHDASHRPLGHLDDGVTMSANALPTAGSPMPAIGGYDVESDIQTNPSEIQGPTSNDRSGHLKDLDAAVLGGAAGAGLGALAHDHLHDREQIPGSVNEYDDEHAGDMDDRNQLNGGYGDDLHRGLSSREGFDDYVVPPTPPNKDEGYISAAPNARSPGALTPDHHDKAPKLFDDNDPDGVRDIDDFLDDEDPFVGGKGHTRHLSGYSAGMPSPLYDSATGKGMDRIQSKDVVALMDHLTVRDAQRNARDTEILVTLVRSAAEMRNSFEDMKRLLSDSERNIILGNEKSTERSIQKHIQGPRPQPLGTPRVPRQVAAARAAEEEEDISDLPAKRRNVFKRAIKGLSMKSSNDITKIEDMFLQLLDEMDELKMAQGVQSGQATRSLRSEGNATANQDGYEPEGHAGTSTTTQSNENFTNPPSRGTSAVRGYDGRRVSEHRISTVPEGDEELYEEDAHKRSFYEESAHTKSPVEEPTYKRSPYEEPVYRQDSFDENKPLSQTRQIRQPQYEDQYEDRLTPSNELPKQSAPPLDTLAKPSAPFATSQSAENTPRTERSRKHKSGSSGFFPKFSRWSETTASTVANKFKGNRKSKDEYAEPVSRSGSEHDFWGTDGARQPRKSDKLHSTYSLENADHRIYDSPRDQRPPSPPAPQTQYQEEEEPHSRAFRDSMNLEHPQPRPGPTHRYQHHLESQAQHFDSPVSPSSEQWGSNPNLQRFSTGSNNRYSGGAGNLSPISDGQSQRSVSGRGGAPPRPAKIPEDPLLPERPPKIRADDTRPQYASPLSSERLQTAGGKHGNGSAGLGYDKYDSSPRSTSGQIPTRKPIGPRAPSKTMGSDGNNSPRRNKNRNTFGSTAPEDDETF